MSYREWFLGMKVVCIVSYGSRSLRTGKVYTIRAFDAGAGFSETLGFAEFGVLLDEVGPNAGCDAFHPARFRPVQPRKTDISCFTQMLNPSKVKVGEPA